MKVNQVVKADCRDVAKQLVGKVDLVYADILYDAPRAVPYEELCLSLKPGGALFIQTDQRSVTCVKGILDRRSHATGKPYYDVTFVNWIIWSYNWGGRAKDKFAAKHDDILYYARVGKSRKFNAKDVSIPKTVMINSKKDWQIPTDVWAGNFYTTSAERIADPKTKRGFRWQKPEWLLERIILATTDPGDLVFEPYLGTGTACAVAKKLGRRYVGCDIEKQMVTVATKRLRAVGKEGYEHLLIEPEG